MSVMGQASVVNVTVMFALSVRRAERMAAIGDRRSRPGADGVPVLHLGRLTHYAPADRHLGRARSRQVHLARLDDGHLLLRVAMERDGRERLERVLG
jgi:hypothetical protein